MKEFVQKYYSTPIKYLINTIICKNGGKTPTSLREVWPGNLLIESTLRKRLQHGAIFPIFNLLPRITSDERSSV